MGNRKRARTEAEKTDRKAAILSVAREMVEGEGFDSVTMSGLAKRAGLAKGTLYLYVKTKEEVFGLLFAEAFHRYVSSVLPHVGDDSALIRAMMSEARRDPLFLPLMARLTTVIEANLSRQALIDLKRAFGGEGGRMAGAIAEARGMAEGEAFDLAHALFVALQGAAQLSAEPPQDGETLPEDVLALYAHSDPELAFAKTAGLILKGARA